MAGGQWVARHVNGTLGGYVPLVPTRTAPDYHFPPDAEIWNIYLRRVTRH